MNFQKDGYTISTDPSMLDMETIHGFLSTSYWSEEVPKAIIEKSIRNSICFGVYEEKNQVGFARVISDRTTFAYLADVFILENHRGKGLSKWLMHCIMEYPDLQGLRRWMLATRDAHGLYAQFGFSPLSKPDRIMEITVPDIYKKAAAK